MREMAKVLGRSHASVSREMRKNFPKEHKVYTYERLLGPLRSSTVALDQRHCAIAAAAQAQMELCLNTGRSGTSRIPTVRTVK